MAWSFGSCWAWGMVCHAIPFVFFAFGQPNVINVLPKKLYNSWLKGEIVTKKSFVLSKTKLKTKVCLKPEIFLTCF